jgi:hypothetical protein
MPEAWDKEFAAQSFFRPSGACSFPRRTQGLRPGLYSFAASRLGAEAFSTL